jgi:hypothetical protein
MELCLTHNTHSFYIGLTIYQGEDLKQWGPNPKEIPSENNGNEVTECGGEGSCLPTELAQMCLGNDFLKRYLLNRRIQITLLG